MSALVSAFLRAKTPVLTAVGSNGVSHVRKDMVCSGSVLRIVQAIVLFSGPGVSCTCSESAEAILGDVGLRLPNGNGGVEEG